MQEFLLHVCVCVGGEKWGAPFVEAKCSLTLTHPYPRYTSRSTLIIVGREILAVPPPLVFDTSRDFSCCVVHAVVCSPPFW
jgi:hypothetical protein